VTVQVSDVVPVQAGLSVDRFVAIEAGLPVYGVLFTLVSVITTDCVPGETYFGVRALDDVVLDAGTVMVNRADAAAGTDPVGALGAAAGTLCVPPPPEQLHRPHKASNARARVRIELLRLPARSAY
jgi:hypothetical protein